MNSSEVIYDPQHFMDFIQASVRGQFNRDDYVVGRARQRVEHARQIWLGFTTNMPAGPEPNELLRYLQAVELAANAIAAHIKTDLRSAVFRRLLELGPVHARGERTGELTSTALERIDALAAYFSQYLPGLALAALVPLNFLWVVFPLDPLSALVLLLTAPLIPLFMVLIGNAAQALTGRQWQVLSRMSADFLDVLQGLTALKLLGRSQALGAVIADVSDRFRQRTMSVLRVTFAVQADADGARDLLQGALLQHGQILPRDLCAATSFKAPGRRESRPVQCQFSRSRQ